MTETPAHTWRDRDAVAETQDNETAWKEKKKQNESARGCKWEDDGYISSQQPGQVCL